jgi:hypothetical protein
VGGLDEEEAGIEGGERCLRGGAGTREIKGRKNGDGRGEREK